MNTVVQKTNVSNDARDTIDLSRPYAVEVKIKGSSDLIFHRWSAEAVEEKAASAKGSKAKKTDNVESYVSRDEHGFICLPGEYVRQSIINAAKFKQDPRSPRKSAMDLFKAGIVCLTQQAPLAQNWDYLDTRRVMVQRAGVNRTRPALKAGWEANLVFQVLTPEYIDEALLHEVLSLAGRLVGVGEMRPTYGRYNIVEFTRLDTL